MPDIVHTFTPKDNSLSERVSAYQRVYHDFANVTASMECVDDKDWADRLGDREEVAEAYEVLQNSLQMAFDSIEQSELAEAKKQGLMSDKDVREFIQTKRRQEMSDRRSSHQNSESSSHSQKQ